MKTFVAKEQDVNKKWYLVDAENKVLGRLATQIAMRLRGKHKAIFTPHADTGDFVVVVNADKVALTGKKWRNKNYYHYTGYIGGLKQMVKADRVTLLSKSICLNTSRVAIQSIGLPAAGDQTRFRI